MGFFGCCPGFEALAPTLVGARRHEPYLWDCLPSVFRTPPPPPQVASEDEVDPAEEPFGGHLCFVRFNYHAEFLYSPSPVPFGSLVVVDGERGVDVGTALSPGSTDLIPVPRPGLKPGEKCYRTCLGLAPRALRAARGRADRLAHNIMLVLRQRTQAAGRHYHFLGVEVQADLQYAVVFYSSGSGDPTLYRHELVPRLYATFHMRFWFEDVDRVSVRLPSAAPCSPPESYCDLPTPVPSPPSTIDDDGERDEEEALDDEPRDGVSHVFVPSPLPV